MRILRVSHAGGDPAQRARDLALIAAGHQVRLITPANWPGADIRGDGELEIVPLPVRRPGDVNRHRYADARALRRTIQEWRPDVVDVHAEPVSLVARQTTPLHADYPIVMYTAQNIAKRWPPPFAQIERRSFERVAAFYPCSRQAAAVLANKGYRGHIDVIPLGLDPAVHVAGQQDIGLLPVTIGFVGRVVREKGIFDAVRVLAHLRQGGLQTRLIVVGEGPDSTAARAMSERLGVSGAVRWVAWTDTAKLAELYRQMHVVLVLSRSTPRWTEQFGRVITESMAAGAVPVGYDTGSVAEVVGAAGVVVREGHVQAVAGAVSALAADGDLWQQLRLAGLARAARMPWSEVARQLEMLYAVAVHLRRPPRPVRRRKSQPSAIWGRSAMTPVGEHPLALPVVRDSPALHRVLEATDRLRGLS